MNSESVYLYDVSHWKHVVTKNMYDVGETVFNADNQGKPVLKRGAAPCELLGLCYTWHTLQDVIEDLQARSFRKVNDTLWIKN